MRVVSPEGPKQLTDEQLSKYIREIDECNNANVQKLSQIEGNKSKNQIARYLYYLNQHEALGAPIEFALSTGPGSVLRKSDIESFCSERTPPLIDPLDPKSLKEAASYELRLGSKYRLGESDSADWLTDSKKDLHIPSHGIAIVSTYEWLNIPGCLIARWNLRVRMVYRGLVWVGSLQVDPGYQGFLFCPIYNLSDREQILIYKDPLFIIDFVLTTPADKYELWEPRGGRYSTFDFDRLDEPKIGSGPEHSFDLMRKDIAKLENKMERFQGVVFLVLAIVIAAVAVIATLGLFGIYQTPDAAKYVGKFMGLSVVAFALSAIALLFSIHKQKK